MIPCYAVTTNDGYWQVSALTRSLVTITRYMLVIPDKQTKHIMMRIVSTPVTPAKMGVFTVVCQRTK